MRNKKKKLPFVSIGTTLLIGTIIASPFAGTVALGLIIIATAPNTIGAVFLRRSNKRIAESNLAI